MGCPLSAAAPLTEKYGVDIEYHCKPLGDTDWNGSGMHCKLRPPNSCAKTGGKEYFEKLMAAFDVNREGSTSPSTARTITWIS